MTTIQQPNQSNSSKHANDSNEAKQPTIKYVTLAQVQQKPLEWIWEGYLVAGKLNGLVGDPGWGKSLVTLDIAARITRGWPMPLTENDAPAHRDRPVEAVPRDVILLCAEDDAADTIAPRIDEAGADLACVHLVKHYEDAEGKRRFMNLANGEARRALLRLARELDARLIIADPLSAFFGKSGDVDMNKDQDVRSVLNEFADELAQTDCAFIGIRHQGKDAGRDPLYRALGSIGFTGVFRAEWGVTCDPEDETQRVFYHLKGNLSIEKPSLAFHITDDGVHHDRPWIVWDGVSRWDKHSLAHVKPTDSPRSFIQGILSEATAPLTVTQLCSRLEETEYEGSTKYRAVQNVVNNMVEAKTIVRAGRGAYARKDAPFLLPQRAADIAA